MLKLLRNAHVFAPDPVGDTDILIAGGTVVGLGSYDPAGMPEAQVVDLEGRTVIPGLVDCHVHVTGGGGEAGYGSSVPPLVPESLVRSGVTTAVGLLGTDDDIRTPDQVVSAVYGLRARGLSAWCYTGGYHLPPVTATGSVRRDIVLVEPVIGVGELAVSDHRSSQPTVEEIRRVAADAHVGGLMSGKAGILHIHVGDGTRGLEPIREAMCSELPARVFHPTHVNRRRALLEEAAELTGRGCSVDLTAFPVEDGEEAMSAADGVERLLELGAPHERITVSSDAGGCLPRFDGDGRVTGFDVGGTDGLWEAVRELAARGRMLNEVLTPFTSNPARLLRLGSKGRIAVGADADLVVLDENLNIESVIAMGRWMLKNGSLSTGGEPA